MARRRNPADAMEAALLERRVIVVCGSGGVGKTTTAAALGLQAAIKGRRVLVCTIDPSRRLATSLGLSQLSGKPRTLDLRRFAPAPGGSMAAMVLDTKSTFDAIVLEFAADERFDLIVLDTPPTRHALDFLEAPDRLMSFLDTSVLRFFLRPYFVAGRLTLKVATRTGAMAFRLIDRFLGLQFLQDLSEFFLAFEGMYDGFKERAARVHALLRDPSSGFVLVAVPSSQALGEALYFHRRLGEKAMPFVAQVVNRVHPDPAQDEAGRRPGRAPRETRIDRDLGERLAEVFLDQQTLARVERRRIDRLEVDARERPILVPELEQDVHDLRGLVVVAEAIFAGTTANPRARRRA